MTDSPDYQYLDLQISNFESPIGKGNSVLNFNTSLENAYLFDPTKYKMAISRFLMDTVTVPKFIPRIQYNSSDPDLTIYGVTLGYDIYKSDTEYIIWKTQTPTDDTPTPPSQNGGLQVNSSWYYNCYSYQYFTRLVNDAFIRALANLRTKYPALNVAIEPPQIYWNCDTNSAEILVQSAYYDMNLGTPMEVYMNESLYNLYNTFEADYVSKLSTAQLRLYMYVIQDVNTLTISGDDYFKIKQEGDCLFQFNPFSSVILVSNSMNVISTTSVAPQIYNNGISLNTSNSDQLSYNIISDFCSPNSYSNALVYEPSLYRWLSLRPSTQPMRSIDLTIYFKNKLTGLLTPFYLGNESVVTVKFLFQKI